MLKRPCAKLEGLCNSLTRTAFAIAAGTSIEEATERARTAVGRLEFVIAPT
jgi:hypothetical protein